MLGTGQFGHGGRDGDQLNAAITTGAASSLGLRRGRVRLAARRRIIRVHEAARGNSLAIR